MLQFHIKIKTTHQNCSKKFNMNIIHSYWKTSIKSTVTNIRKIALATALTLKEGKGVNTKRQHILYFNWRGRNGAKFKFIIISPKASMVINQSEK